MQYTKITISGTICSGKSTLVADLRQKLGWPLFSTSQLFRQEAKRQHLSLDEAGEQNAKLTKEIDAQIQTQLHMHEHIIVEAWMGGIMAAGELGVLKVFLTAKDSIRFNRFAKREGIVIEEATKRVRQREQNWLEKLTAIYNRSDFYDTKHYDLVIDTSILKPSQVSKLVLEKLDI